MSVKEDEQNTREVGEKPKDYYVTEAKRRKFQVFTMIRIQ